MFLFEMAFKLHLHYFIVFVNMKDKDLLSNIQEAREQIGRLKR